ncbi:uncharacterized, partial [Tachysurus ichikawai]
IYSGVKSYNSRCAVCFILIHFKHAEDDMSDAGNPSSVEPGGFSASSRTTAVPEQVPLS